MGKTTQFSTEEVVAEKHAWREMRSFHPEDDYLREHGFKIASRPRNGPDKWVRSGHEYTVEQAVKLADDE